MGIFQSGQMGQTVNLLVFTFGGSNPSVPTVTPYYIIYRDNQNKEVAKRGDRLL